MRILSWNINSVRLRKHLLTRLIKETDPDIVALQETKTPDEHFPFEEVTQSGLKHIHIHGMKSYNGVAVLSKYPFLSSDIHCRVSQEDCRHISVKMSLPGTQLPFHIHTLYVPAGGDIPDPALNVKYRHKLDFLEEMTLWFQENHTQEELVVALGDFNVAPLEHDVWSHKQLLKVVSHTPPETERLEKMRRSLNWTDCARHFVPSYEKCYTWWSYRNRDWRKSDRGRRLDHIWVTPPLKGALSGHTILKEARDWSQPSDHVPILIDIDTEKLT